jgi:hypothetical protein
MEPKFKVGDVVSILKFNAYREGATGVVIEVFDAPGYVYDIGHIHEPNSPIAFNVEEKNLKAGELTELEQDILRTSSFSDEPGLRVFSKT